MYKFETLYVIILRTLQNSKKAITDASNSEKIVTISLGVWD